MDIIRDVRLVEILLTVLDRKVLSKIFERSVISFNKTNVEPRAF